MKKTPQPNEFLLVLLGGTIFSQWLLIYEMQLAAFAVIAATSVVMFFIDRGSRPTGVRAGFSLGFLAAIGGFILLIHGHENLGVPLSLLGVSVLIWSTIKRPTSIVEKPTQMHVGDAAGLMATSVRGEANALDEESAMSSQGFTCQQDEVLPQTPSLLKSGFDYSAVTLPPDYPSPPTRWESQMAAVLLTHGKLKGFTHEMGFGTNGASQVPLLNDRELAESIIQRVPHIRIPVYESVTPPLTDHPERDLEDWEEAMEDYHMRPMPSYVHHLPARVTAFTSYPWGRIGVFLVVFDDPEKPVRWGLWYLREPSAKSGCAMPFFRLGDFDDAELLAWLVMKPFLDAQGVVLDDMNPPEQSSYLGPWHRLGNTLSYQEMPDWFAKALSAA